MIVNEVVSLPVFFVLVTPFDTNWIQYSVIPEPPVKVGVFHVRSSVFAAFVSTTNPVGALAWAAGVPEIKLPILESEALLIAVIRK